MPNSNNGQVVLGLDIPKTVNQINADIKKLEKQLEQVKATGALDTDKTVKQLNAQIKSLQAQLKTIEIKATVDPKSIQKTGQQIGSQIKNATKGSSVASEILNASDLDKQGKTYILKVSNTIEATKKEIQSKLRNSGYFDIEIKGVEKANGQIKSVTVNATNAKGVLEQLNFERAKMQKGGKVTNALVQTDDVKVLGTLSSSIDKVHGNLSTLKTKWEEQGVLVSDFKTKVEQLENSLASVGSKGELNGLESQIKTLKAEASQIAEVNKIQHSLDVGDYDAQIETIKKGFVSLSGSADEAETHVDSLRKALQAMHDATDNDSKILAEKNYRLELEKTQNELTISKAKAKEYVDTFKVNKLRNDIQDWLKKNTAATKEAKDAMQLYLNMLDGDKVSPIDFNTVKSGFDDWDTKMRQAGKLGKSLTETFKEGAKSFATWAISSGAVMDVVNVVRQGVDELKDLDDILTEISKTSDLTKQELTELGLSAYDTASKYGREASDYLSGVQSMSQSGFYGEQGKAMAEQSLLAQAAGDMSQEIADKYIIATNAAYKFNGEATKLNAVLDGQNSIANQNSVALEDMATAMSEAGTVASSYNVAVEDFSAMVGTIESVTKSGGSEVGNALKSILINLQNVTSSKITGTLEKANASMTEFVNGTEQLRNPIDILRDLAVTFNSLEDSDPLRAEILTNVAGKYQSAKLAALLENMTLFDKMLIDYSEGSGSALEEANKSATNLTGSLNTLKNSTNELINVFVSADGLKSGVNVLNALTQGATNLVEALSPLGTIATIGSGILGAKGSGLTNYVTQS